MDLYDGPLDRIEERDLRSLVENEVKEGLRIEYKETLPGGTDAEKKEFLADASSFANASGGDVLCGVKEKRDARNNPTGIPEKLSENATLRLARRRARGRSSRLPRLPRLP